MSGQHSVDPFDYVIFGGTGDLSLRKIYPALWHRDMDDALPAESRVIAASRRALDRAEFRALVERTLRASVAAPPDPAPLARFLDRLDHVTLDATGERGWHELRDLLGGEDRRVRCFYLATAPDLFGTICRRLRAHGIDRPESRVVLEKPIGHDLASSRRLNDAVGEVFDERQIYRIDHYLGKETVQNLLALRFANSLFEPLWRGSMIDHVQITVAETLGVETRGGYYDGAGALRDMVQNHLLQLLCLIAMEPPGSDDREAVRDEKLKVLRALRPITGEAVNGVCVRGQYRAGTCAGEGVPGYQREPGIAPDSRTETFVALKAEVRNWRWAGTPFYLRTGKRLPEKVSEIVIQFRPVPHSIFARSAGEMRPNLLVVRVQPDEAIRLHLMTKEPGPGGVRLKPATLNLSFAETFKRRFPEAYERLLLDVVRGNPTLFMRRDEVEAAWSWTGGILEAWRHDPEEPKPYAAGSWGPAAATTLIERDGRSWFEGSMPGH